MIRQQPPLIDRATGLLIQYWFDEPDRRRVKKAARADVPAGTDRRTRERLIRSYIPRPMIKDAGWPTEEEAAQYEAADAGPFYMAYHWALPPETEPAM